MSPKKGQVWALAPAMIQGGSQAMNMTPLLGPKGFRRTDKAPHDEHVVKLNSGWDAEGHGKDEGPYRERGFRGDGSAIVSVLRPNRLVRLLSCAFPPDASRWDGDKRRHLAFLSAPELGPRGQRPRTSNRVLVAAGWAERHLRAGGRDLHTTNRGGNPLQAWPASNLINRVMSILEARLFALEYRTRR
ncbi:hypothetical protein GQ53DRAFT_92439 [Thozetella sp. PMI_491]|nr:hypothetical protein GQ53DRAFT_92439 [Thozetella sp. PMI_491]